MLLRPVPWARHQVSPGPTQEPDERGQGLGPPSESDLVLLTVLSREPCRTGCGASAGSRDLRNSFCSPTSAPPQPAEHYLGWPPSGGPPLPQAESPGGLCPCLSQVSPLSPPSCAVTSLAPATSLCNGCSLCPLCSPATPGTCATPLFSFFPLCGQFSPPGSPDPSLKPENFLHILQGSAQIPAPPESLPGLHLHTQAFSLGLSAGPGPFSLEDTYTCSNVPTRLWGLAQF